MGASGQDGAGVGVAGADRVGVRGWLVQQRGLAAPRGVACRRSASGERGSSRIGWTGLQDEPRPGAPRKITDAQVEAVIVKTLEEAPSNQDSHWSTRSMAKATGLNQTACRGSGGRSASSRIWWTPGSCPRIRCSSTRSVTWSGCISTRRTRRWSSRWMRSPRCRPSTAPRRCCR